MKPMGDAFRVVVDELKTSADLRCAIVPMKRTVGPDRVLADDKNNGDRLCCRLGRQSHIITCCGDHGDLTANQIGRKLWQPIALVLGKPVYDRHILTFDIATLFQALPICTQTFRDRVSRSEPLAPPAEHAPRSATPQPRDREA
jgi:hypothetical protein